MSQIQITNLTFAYPGASKPIFDNVSLSFDTSWKLGLIGRNGRGKTTFLKILAGELNYKGFISSPIPFEYCNLDLGENDKGKTLLQTFLDSGCNAEYWEIEKELNSLGMKSMVLDQQTIDLSYGEISKAALALLFLKNTKFLLIDEPTNHLDYQARKAVASYLAKKSGFVLVSHDRNFINQSVDHILSINKSSIELQKGNFDSWLQNRDRQDNFEMAQNIKLKGEIERLEQSYKRTANWSDKIEKGRYRSGGDRGFIGHKSAKMMKRSKSIEKRQANAIHEKESLLKDFEPQYKLELVPKTSKTEVIAIFEDVAVKIGEKVVLPKVSFELKKQSRLAIIGPNGSGKSTILKILAGVDIPYSGRFWVSKSLDISYCPQGTSFLKGSIKNLIKTSGVDETIYMTTLDKLALSKESFNMNLEDLSEGERKKTLIALSLSKPSHLYIMDEPLNYLDVFTRMAIESLILKTNPTMVVAEHDKAFIESIATEILDIGK